MATVTAVTNHFITAKEGFSTTLASSISSGATIVPLNSTAGYTDGDVVALTIEPASSTAKQVFTGTKSGTSIINVVWTEGTNQAHAAGVTVIDYTSATHQAALVKGLLVGNNQNGTRKAFTETAIVPTASLQDGSVTTVKLSAAAVTGAKMSSPGDKAYADQANQSFVSGTSAQITGASKTFTTTGGKVFVAFSANQVYVSAGTAVFRLFVDGTYNQDLAQVSPGTATSNGGAVGFTIVSGLSAASHTFSIQLLNSGGATQLLQFNSYSFAAFEIGT